MGEKNGPKPGYKSTEFWLSIAAVLLGCLLASGLLTENPSLEQMVTLGITALAALGYTAGRSFVKATRDKASAHVEANKPSADGASGG